MGQLDLLVRLSLMLTSTFCHFRYWHFFVLSSFIVRWLGCLTNRFPVMQCAVADTRVDLCQYRRILLRFTPSLLIYRSSYLLQLYVLILNALLCCPNDSRCYSAQTFRSFPSVADMFDKTQLHFLCQVQTMCM